MSFDKDWLFTLYDYGTEDSAMQLENPTLDDSTWQPLDLPHDWAIEGGFDMDLPNNTGKLPYSGLGWYRKHFTLPASDNGKQIFIDFDGAMSHAKVWLNGQYIGQWPYGYASFRLELTEHIKFGQDNVLAVRLNNPDNSSRWYPGGGIYRHTRLVKTNPVHVAHWGTYVTTPVITSEAATVQIQTEIQNQSDADAAVTVEQEIALADTPGTIIAASEPQVLTIAAGTIEPLTQTVSIANPMLWDIENPTLYVVRTTIKMDGKTQDIYETTFGIRTAVFDAKKGFLLNGKHVYLKGVCLHHDLGPLGAAVYRRGLERQLEILKEMGCNSIRTSHNPPTPELLELCDTMGFVVIDEAFDCWAKGKTHNDYAALFKDWHEKDIVAMVHRDRNHPSVILWSSGNEIREQGSISGHALSRQLTEIFHREDPTRPVTAGCNYPQSASNGFADTVDVYGFNYKPHMYKEFIQQHPEQPFYSSESSSCISSRGEYFFPVSDKKDEGFFNYQVSSYDLYAPGWAMSPDREFKGQDENPACAGEYVWTGFDYLGEPTPYNSDKTIALNYHSEAEKKRFESMLAEMEGKCPSRSSYFGIVDLCGFKKDRFYIYQARWRPDMPMAHILPHWNWPDRIGEVTPVHVYTSGDEAELFLNGKSLGRKRKQSLEKQDIQGNLAEGKETVCSSHQTSPAGTWRAHLSNERWRGNDGESDTRWCAADGTPNQWWQVDLGDIQPIKSCVIYWEKTADHYQCRLQVSKDNENWKTVGQSNFEGDDNHTFWTFDEQGRYVRVETTGLKDNVWASFFEFQVFNDPAPTIQSDNPNMNYYRLRWDDVVYEPGTLKVVAYKDGKAWAQEIVSTTGQAQRLELLPDRSTIYADGDDLSYITLKVTDENGVVVPQSNPNITFSLDGPGEIIATGNGNAIDLTSFLSKERKAYNGLCLVIVRSVEGKTGTIRVTAVSDGLRSAEVTIVSE